MNHLSTLRIEGQKNESREIENCILKNSFYFLNNTSVGSLNVDKKNIKSNDE